MTHVLRASLLLLSLSLSQAAGAVVPGEALASDFFLDIDGISVDLSARYFCVLEQVPSSEVGGVVRCFGGDELVQAPPKDVFVQVGQYSHTLAHIRILLHSCYVNIHIFSRIIFAHTLTHNVCQYSRTLTHPVSLFHTLTHIICQYSHTVTHHM